MSKKSILTIVNGNTATQGAIRLSFSISKSLKAHNKILFTTNTPQHTLPIIGENISRPVMDDIIDTIKEKTSEATEATLNAIDITSKEFNINKQQDVPIQEFPSYSYHKHLGNLTEIVANHGRMTDFIVVGRTNLNDDDSDASELIETAIFQTGHSVVLAPSDYSGEYEPKKIAFLWRGSLEGARALTGALPFIEQADSVCLIGNKREMPIDEMKHYFSCHRIEVQVQDLDLDNTKNVGEEIARICDDNDMDMLVMGAYVKGRLRNWIFGGLTSNVIEEIKIPILMRI